MSKLSVPQWLQWLKMVQTDEEQVKYLKKKNKLIRDSIDIKKTKVKLSKNKKDEKLNEGLLKSQKKRDNRLGKKLKK